MIALSDEVKRIPLMTAVKKVLVEGIMKGKIIIFPTILQENDFEKYIDPRK